MLLFNQFSKLDTLLTALAAGDSKAILYLQDKATGLVKNILLNRGLPDHLLYEVLNDSTVVFIKKVREPGFILNDTQPITFFLGIAKYVISNKTRTRQFSGNTTLDDQHHLSDHSVEQYYAQKEQREVLSHLFTKIGEPCSSIIQLKYLEGLSDKEIVQGKLTIYKSEESLRVKRSDCMKNLRTLAQASKKII